MLSIYAVIRSYAWDTMGRQLYVKSGANAYYQITDPHDDNVAWASATALVGTQHFDPWGNLTYTPSGTTTPFGFQGAMGSWTDATTSFVSMGVRWYYPKVSEFLSSDPAAGTADPRTPADRMRWLYAANEPVENSDPTGLMHVDAPADNCDSACMANVAAMEAQQAADARENRQHQIAQHSRDNIRSTPKDPGVGKSWLVINGYDVGQHLGNAGNAAVIDPRQADLSQLTWQNLGTAAVGWVDEGVSAGVDMGCTASGIDVCAFVDTHDYRHHVLATAINAAGGHIDTNSDAYNDGRIAFVVASTVAGGRGALSLARGGLSLLRGGTAVADAAEAGNVAPVMRPAYGPGAASPSDPAFAPRFYRGAAPGETPSFKLKPNEYRMTGTGQVRGLSVFNDPAEIKALKMIPWEVDQSTVSDLLSIEQRGANVAHFEIIPGGGAFPPQEEFQGLLDQIGVLPPG